MELKYILDNIGDVDKIIPALQKNVRGYSDRTTVNAFEIASHNVLDKTKRPDIVKEYETTEVDSLNNSTKDFKTQFVTRIAIPLQKLIVYRSVVFLTGGGVDLMAKPENAQQPLFDKLQGWWDVEQLEVKLAQAAEAAMSEGECAMVFFSRVVDKGGSKKVAVKSRLYKPSEDFTLMPVYNSEGDMVAFALEGEYEDDENKKVRYVRLYTDKISVDYVSVNGAYVAEKPIPHKYGKIPVVYWAKNEVEWADVQSAIDRLETTISNFCDTNDYFAAPILAIIGQALGVADKGGTGQAVQLEEGADVKYLTWSQVPEAIKYEVETMNEIIYGGTQTPNISFSVMKSLGDITGPAFDRMMIDSHLKAKRYQNGWYGEGVRRCINFSVAALAVANKMEAASDLEVTPLFKQYRINDVRETVEVLLLANGNKALVSQEDAIKLAGLTNDVAKTAQEIRQDEERAAELKIKIAGHSDDTSTEGEEGSKGKTDDATTKKTVRMGTTNGQNAVRA